MLLLLLLLLEEEEDDDDNGDASPATRHMAEKEDDDDDDVVVEPAIRQRMPCPLAVFCTRRNASSSASVCLVVIIKDGKEEGSGTAMAMCRR